jgi:hypothetical protein
MRAMIDTVNTIARRENRSEVDVSFMIEARPVAPKKVNRNVCGALKTKVVIA